MTEPPRRSRFQMHLSTAIVLMIVAGGLFWANLREAHRFTLNQSVPGFLFRNEEITWSEYGWPLEAMSHLNVKDLSGLPQSMLDDLNRTDFITLAINFSVAVLILFFVFYVCDRLIRHLAFKKGA